ncbi:MAG TPA: hypothetical protein VGI03_04850 [Verrucomicrobiae bacterium]|jgi:hypothetical protein
MRIKRSTLMLALACALAAGCDKRVSVGGDYKLVQPRTYLIDSGSPACALYYQGKSVWPSVLVSSDQSYHDGFFIFLAAVPDYSGDYNDYSITPQLFAIKGAGPPVILSERLFNLHMIDWDQPYNVENITPKSNGFSVEFAYDAGDTQTNLDITWPEIQGWVQEAETSAPVRVTSLGNYRTLLMEGQKRDFLITSNNEIPVYRNTNFSKTVSTNGP